jgi:nucleotide-binding universal stress UspA family protein
LLYVKEGKVRMMKILVGYDGSESSKKAVEKAKELTSTCHISDIMIVHVLKEDPMEGASYFDAVNMEQVEKTIEQAIVREMRELNEIAEEFENGFIQTKFLKGDPATVIADYAKDHGYDLIIVGSRGRSGIMKWMPGSVSNAVVNNCCISVMVVK